MIDQFIAAAEEKWCDPSRLVMLLPHGLEGQGPEHSSARPERYLQLAARENIRVVNPSTPANYFHLLREQALGRFECPLVVMGAKKLLRLPAALSPLADFLPGTGFRPVVATLPAGPVARVLLCSGKIAYELEAERAARQAGASPSCGWSSSTPSRPQNWRRCCAAGPARAWPGCRRSRRIWVPGCGSTAGWRRWRRNAGCPRHARPMSAGRTRPSPAGSFHGDHDADQHAIVERAFAGLPQAAAEAAE